MDFIGDRLKVAFRLFLVFIEMRGVEGCVLDATYSSAS
jgi:hypothetical protein